MADAKQHIVDGVQAFFGIEHPCKHFLEVRDNSVAVPNGLGERLQAAFACRAGQGTPFGLIRQIKIFEAFDRVRGQNGLFQIVGELALAFDAAQNCPTPIAELAQEGNARLNKPKHIFLEAAGSLFAIAGDKRNRIPLVQKLNDVLDLNFAYLQALGYARKIERVVLADDVLGRRARRSCLRFRFGRRHGRLHGGAAWVVSIRASPSTTTRETPPSGPLARIDPKEKTCPREEQRASSAYASKAFPGTFLAAMWQWQIQSRVLRQSLSGPI